MQQLKLVQATPLKPFSAITSTGHPSWLGRVTNYNRNFGNEWKHHCCAGKTPKLLNIIEGESSRSLWWSKRLQFPFNNGYHILWYFTYFIIFSSFAEEQLRYHRAHLLHCLSLHRGIAASIETTLFGTFSLPQQGDRRWVTTRPGSQGSAPLGATPLQLIPGEWFSLKDFFTPLAEKEITTELTSPGKTHDSGKSLKIKWGVGGGISQSPKHFLWNPFKTQKLHWVSSLVEITGEAFLSFLRISSQQHKQGCPLTWCCAF